MAIKTETDISPEIATVWNKAKSSVHAKNHDYTLMLLQSVLKSEPLFLDARKYLRRAAIEKFKLTSTFSKKIAGMKIASILVKASGQIKRAPAEAMSIVEEALAKDPYHIKANKILAQTAEALDSMETALFAYEMAAEGHPQDRETLFALAECAALLKDFKKAITTYEKVLKFAPNDGEALTRMKNASASFTSNEGGWDKSQNYREMLQNKETSKKLEQASKITKSKEAIEEQIAALYALTQSEPDNLTHPKQIGELCTQIKDYENAIAWYTYAFEKGGQTDVSIEKNISTLEVQRIDQSIEEAKKASQADGGASEHLSALITQRKDLVLTQSRQRLTRYPNDSEFRFEHGVALFDVDRYRDALPELQLGSKHPSVRLEAMKYIALCHLKLGMTDIAIKTLVNTAAEIPSMNDTKKEILYHLGQAYKISGRPDEALEQFKLIYEVDMLYKDVAAEVEGSYSA